MPANDPSIDGDTQFIGVNMRLDPGQLKPGLCAFAKNKRFINGKAATRPGIKKMPWTNKAYAAWTNDPDPSNPKSYSAGDIVTYSGVAAEVEGEGSSAAVVEGGLGTLHLRDANRLNFQNGDFSSNSNWVFTGATAVVSEALTLVGSSTVFASVAVEPLSMALSTNDTITFQYGGVFTLSSPASSGGTSITGTLTVASVNMHEEGALSAGWTYNASNDSAEVDNGTATLNLYQDISALKGCKYSVTYTVNNWTAGSIQPFISQSASSTGVKQTYSVSTNQPATFTDEIVPRGINPQRLYLQASGGFRGEVTSVSVVPVNLPDEVDILGTFEQWNNNWRAAGPASNRTAGPFFKAAQTNSDEPPLTSYTALSGETAASSSVNTANWTDLGHRTYGYGTVYGAGIFRNPTGIEHLLVATADGVYSTNESNASLLLEPWASGGGAAIASDVTFTQCFNVVIMHRGKTLAPLMMERLDEGFKSVTKLDSDLTIEENEKTGAEQIPNSEMGLFFANRLLVPFGTPTDMVACSDALSYSSYSPVLSNFRINQGEESELVSLVRINNSTIACFKTNSIYMVSNIYGNLSDIVLDEVTREYGAISRESIVQVGNDVVFLSSKKGVTSLGIASHGKVAAIDVPLSEPIQPLIDRINWNYASGAAAAYHNNRLYMAVPLDNADYNSAILVYDYLSKAWAGYDDGPAVKVKQFVETVHQGKRRLFFLSTDGFINLYDDELTECGFVDETPDPDDPLNGLLLVNQISDEITTRGYTAGDISSKKWKSAEVQLATNDSKFTIKAKFDGPEEDGLELTPTGGQTLSRSSYDRPFDRPDYAESMSGDDFMTKYRQDYSVNPDTEIALPLPTIANGVTTYNDTGFDPDIHQLSQNRYRYRGEGRFVQLNITNTNGRVELVGAKVGGLPGQNLTTKMI